jgi:hypothetical protein
MIIVTYVYHYKSCKLNIITGMMQLICITIFIFRIHISPYWSQKPQEVHTFEMETKTTPVHLTSRGKAKFFPCPVVWTVEEAEGRIRTRFDLSGGGIECNNVPMWSIDVIGKAEGVLTFVGGQDLPQRQPVQPPPGKLSM